MKVLAAVGACALLISASCTSAQKTMPTMGIGRLAMEANLERDDLVVLDAVEGSSSTTSILCGLIKFIDGDKFRFLGINFGFTDKYTYFTPKPGFFQDPIGWLFYGPSTEDRAYYKALEKTPEADIVLTKGMDREVSGFPILWETTEVTFRGKAFEVRPDGD